MHTSFPRHWLRGLALLLALGGGLVFPTGPAAQAANQLIYGDALAPGWQNYSWAPNNVLATDQIYSGSNAIAVSFNAGYQGLYLANAGLFAGGATMLRFYIHGGTTGGQQIKLYLSRDTDPQDKHGPELTLPLPQAGHWSEVRLSLAELGADQATITGIVWQDASGGAQAPFYLDEIALIDDTSPDRPILSDPSLHPFALPADGTTQLRIRVRAQDPQGSSDISAVSVDLSALGSGTLTLADDGLHDDGAAGDSLYGGFATAAKTPAGEVNLVAHTADRAGHSALLPLGALVILSPPGGNVPPSLPQRMSWGTNQWNKDDTQDWQAQSGVPWSYVYQYITYEWYQDGWRDDPNKGFVEGFVEQAWRKNSVPVVSVYLMLALPPACGESAECYARKLQDPTAVQNYFAALTEAARQARGNRPVIFHLEPDFYGFMQRYTIATPLGGIVADDPTSVPVALNRPGYPNTLAGFGRRMVDVIHKEAPNALVAPHASMWATNSEPNQVNAAQATVQAERTAAFIVAMGGYEADLLVIEWSDRDAGSGLQPWWDDTNQTLPRINRALLWANKLSLNSGKRLLLWQVPVGNVDLDNTPTRYRDNRVAYAFRHPRDLADSGVAAVLFGPGANTMTSPATDGGFLAAQGRIAYDPPPAPASLNISHSAAGFVQLSWPPVDAPDLWGYQLTLTRASNEQQIVRRLSRAPYAQLLVPDAGLWQVEVQSYDAMGQLSLRAASAAFTLDGQPRQTRLPLIGS